MVLWAVTLELFVLGSRRSKNDTCISFKMSIKVGQHPKIRDNISSLLWFLWLVMEKRTQQAGGGGRNKLLFICSWLFISYSMDLYSSVLTHTEGKDHTWTGRGGMLVRKCPHGNAYEWLELVVGGFHLWFRFRSESSYSMLLPAMELEIGIPTRRNL